MKTPFGRIDNMPKLITGELAIVTIVLSALLLGCQRDTEIDQSRAKLEHNATSESVHTDSSPAMKQTAEAGDADQQAAGEATAVTDQVAKDSRAAGSQIAKDAGSAGSATGVATGAAASAVVQAAIGDAGGFLDPSLSKAFPSKIGEWPMWGGTPARNMVNPVEKNIPSEWDIKSGKNIKWKQKLGSQTYGNVVIWQGKIFVGTNNEATRNPKIKGDKGVIMCFQESDGEFLWQITHDKLEAGRVNDWPEQGICSAPVAQDGRIYYISNRAEIVAADAEGFLDGENDGPFKDEKYKDKKDGDFIWIHDMMEEDGVFPHNLATCSPLVVGDIVYVITSNGVERDHITIPNPRAPSFMALDKNTGELLWDNADPGENILHGQWAAPGYSEAGGRPQVLFPGGDGWLRSYEPKTGKKLWEFDLNPKDSKWELGGRGTRNSLISTPAAVGDFIYLAVGQDPEHGEGVGHLFKIDGTKGGNGEEITTSSQKWHYGDKEFRRTVSSFAIADGLVYAADLSGFLHCLDAETGRPYWVYDTFAAVWGSPTVIDGKVFMGDEDGDIVVLEHGKKQKVLSEMNMDNAVYSTPVAAKGVLYISSRTHLYAIEQK